MVFNDEGTLLTKVSKGDEKAFACLYRRYFSEIKTYVLRYVKLEAHAEDICQEIFLIIWGKRNELVTIGSFRAFLFTMARNQAFNFLKHAAVERTVQEEIARNAGNLKNYTDEEFQTAEYLQYIDLMLARIPPRSREVFELCRENGNSYTDTAQQLGISSNAVKKHMVRTMKVLKLHVRKDFGLSFSLAAIDTLLFHH
jgi:RNA polymerase sigma-70 factor (family 1)